LLTSSKGGSRGSIKTLSHQKVIRNNISNISSKRLDRNFRTSVHKNRKFLSDKKPIKSESLTTFNPYAYTGQMGSFREIYENHCNFYEGISKQLF
jgi:hypothetical protein